MVSKFFKEFNGTKAEFASKAANYNDYIVFIKDEANNGAGACIYTRGMYFADMQSLISALAFVKGINVGGESYDAAAGGGYVKFEAADPATVVYVENNGIKIGLSNDFVNAHDQIISDVAAIKADYLKASDKEELNAAIAKLASSEELAALDERVETLEGEMDAVEGDIESLGQRITNEAPVTMTEAEGTGDVLKTYTFTQNGKEIGKINLAKELVVTSGSIVEDEGVKYLQLTIANQTEPVKIAVTDLVDVYTAGDYVSISDANVISVDKDAIISGLATEQSVSDLEARVKANEDAVATVDSRIATAKSEAINEAASSVDTKLADYAKADDVYTKTEVDDLLDDKADASALESYKTEVSNALASKVDNSALESYKSEVTEALDGKVDDADLENYCTKTEVDGKLEGYYTQEEVDAMFAWETIE